MSFTGGRLNLNNPIQSKTIVPKITLKRINATTFCFEIQIWVNGKDSPLNPTGSDPEADTARDIFLSPTELFVGEHLVTLTSPPGTNTSTMSIQSTIGGKIPGTTDLRAK